MINSILSDSDVDIKWIPRNEACHDDEISY